MVGWKPKVGVTTMRGAGRCGWDVKLGAGTNFVLVLVLVSGTDNFVDFTTYHELYTLYI